jgi:hypothetical protein
MKSMGYFFEMVEKFEVLFGVMLESLHKAR